MTEKDLLEENERLTALVKRLTVNIEELDRRLKVGSGFFVDTDWCHGVFYYCAEDNSAYIIANVNGAVRYTELRPIENGECVEFSPIITDNSLSEQPANKSKGKFSQKLRKLFRREGV